MKKELLESIAPLLVLMVAYLCKEGAIILKAKYKTLQKPKKMMAGNHIISEIKEVMREICNEVGAQRCHILGYHNSIKTASSVCFDYLSIQIEVTMDAETMPLQNDFQNMPLAQFSELIDLLDNKKALYIPENEHSMIGAIHRSLGVIGAYKFVINKYVTEGTLTIAWHKNFKELTETQIGFIQDRLVRINMLLEKKK